MTVVLEHGQSLYLLDRGRVARPDQADVPEGDLADEWKIEKSNPYITWVSGNFVEADRPNSNRQYWSAADLEIAEYSILHAPVNMIHKFRTPVGFFAATRQVKPRRLSVVDDAKDEPSPLAIQVLGGIWSHIFPFETALIEAADAEDHLFFSMECRGTHLTCAGDQGCGETFDYMRPDTHCAHLMERSSIRHIVNPTFRGGALIVPPTKPGWTGANASVVGDAVMQEAAKFAEQNEAAYKALEDDGVTMTAAGWESLMSLIIATAVGVR